MLDFSEAYRMKIQLWRATHLIQMLLAQRRAYLLPKYASQSYVELVQVFRPGSHIAQICEPVLWPVKHILAVNIRGKSTQADDRATK
ncbi:hypothetical protein ccbrp13_71390 [Ktedonobacteria bacterium brp13]|nr:hypothetical protein ccbrp13_71390 [Ktedonobacteria bacterium brp13]